MVLEGFRRRVREAVSGRREQEHSESREIEVYRGRQQPRPAPRRSFRKATRHQANRLASAFDEYVLDQPPKDKTRLAHYKQRRAAQRRHYTQPKYGAERSIIGIGHGEASTRGRKRGQRVGGLGVETYSMFQPSTFRRDALFDAPDLFDAPNPFGYPPRRRRR